MSALKSTDEISVVYREAKGFLQSLSDSGWLESTGISSNDSVGAADLFHQQVVDRPLVVGLFGGTGVGKSSLLNRLAGSSVAKAGVVRPTSLEITAYMHDSRDVDSLPEGFSADLLGRVKHKNSDFKDVLWVDMPDFDSDETANREQVLQWIPYIDLLIYVVTPERYKDEQGWRLLMSEGYRHGWLFVMNQWDKADPLQLDDFILLLKHSGFDQPKVFKTVGVESAVEADEFRQLAELVTGLAERNVVEQLEQVGWFRRLESVQRRLEEPVQSLTSHVEGLTEVFTERWDAVTKGVAANLSLPFSEYAAKFSESEKSPVRNALRSVTGSRENATPIEFAALARDAGSLWDRWSQVRLNDAITEFELATEEHGVPSRRLSDLRSQLEQPGFENVGQSWGEKVTEAFINPGPRWQRLLQTALGRAKVVLPIAAILWIAFRVMTGFIDGASDADAYVGTDIIANGALLILFAWLLPWMSAYLTRPSVPQAVKTALSEQLDLDLEKSVVAYRAALNAITAEREQLKSDARLLQGRIKSVLSRSSVLAGDDVRDLLMYKSGTPGEAQGVRANAHIDT